MRQKVDIWIVHTWTDGTGRQTRNSSCSTQVSSISFTLLDRGHFYVQPNQRYMPIFQAFISKGLNFPLLTIIYSSRQISTTKCTNITKIIGAVQESRFNPSWFRCTPVLSPSLTRGKHCLRSDESEPRSWTPAAPILWGTQNMSRRFHLFPFASPVFAPY